MTSCMAGPTFVNMKSTLDVNLARKLISKGNNKIKGSALIRQSGGGVVTCAGNQVSLIPKTEYSTERMLILYRNTNKGYKSLYDQSKPASRDAHYDQLMIKKLCDGQGYFNFKNVADGEFYIVTGVSWRVGYDSYGGSLMKSVKVNGGETVEVVLSP